MNSAGKQDAGSSSVGSRPCGGQDRVLLAGVRSAGSSHLLCYRARRSIVGASQGVAVEPPLGPSIQTTAMAELSVAATVARVDPIAEILLTGIHDAGDPKGTASGRPPRPADVPGGWPRDASLTQMVQDIQQIQCDARSDRADPQAEHSGDLGR